LCLSTLQPIPCPSSPIPAPSGNYRDRLDRYTDEELAELGEGLGVKGASAENVAAHRARLLGQAEAAVSGGYQVRQDSRDRNKP
jgi:hypothetical protein